jgi:hypothetical protein
MKKYHDIKFLLFTIILIPNIYFLKAQNIKNERVQIKGRIIISLEEPLGGITIFNSNSLNGTVTNTNGVFLIDVRVGDQLIVSSVQYQSITLEVTDKTLVNNETVIKIIPDITVLKEVKLDNRIIMIGGGGNIDMNHTLKNANQLASRTPMIDRMSQTFIDRVRQPEDYDVVHEAANQSAARYNDFNIVGLLAALAINLTIDNLRRDGEPENTSEQFNVTMVKNKFEVKRLQEFIQIKEEYIYDFLYYANDAGLNKAMLKPEKELEMLAFLDKIAEEYRSRNPLSVLKL